MFTKLAQESISQGYSQSKNDYSFFVRKQGTSMTILYVDDVIQTEHDNDEIMRFKTNPDRLRLF